MVRVPQGWILRESWQGLGCFFCWEKFFKKIEIFGISEGYLYVALLEVVHLVIAVINVN